VVESIVAGLLQLIVLTPDVKVTVPVGPVGVSFTPLSVAVNVTGELSAADVVGEMVSVGLSLVMVWLTGVAAAVA
jgi:hypothetical protein